MSGKWTAKLVPDINRWIERKFVKDNYYLTQLLSEVGYFYKYLFKLGKMTQINCIYDTASIDDRKYTFFHCERWKLEKENLEAKVGVFTVENFCDVILNSEENCNSIASYTEALLKSKKFYFD